MNREELLESLNRLLVDETIYAEDSIQEADRLLLEYINDEEITDVYHKIERKD